jgi:carbamoyl-phosphate synthase small subunit
LALAFGATTYKLPYGHRGGNQPVKNHVNGEVLITAHNHGYAVDGSTLPAELLPTMTNLNDNTNEGFSHRTLPIAAVQFHPEASPGPGDARKLFKEWLGPLACVG